MFIAVHPETGDRVLLEYDNVFAVCPCCGAEHSVDIVELAKEIEKFDLCGTDICCEACAAVRRSAE